MKIQFRSYLRAPSLAGLLVATAMATSTVALHAGDLLQQLAIHTYTLRNLTFEQAIEFAQRHGIKELQLTSNHRVATPANWQDGQDCIIVTAVKDAEVPALFPKGSRTVKPYLRYTPQPNR